MRYQCHSPKDFKTYIVPVATPTTASSTTSTSRTLPRSRRPYHPSRRRHRPAHLPAPNADTALLHRRRIYREGLYSLHVGSNRLSRFRHSLTPHDFATDEELVSKARKWIRRELQVFDFLSHPPASSSSSSSSNAEFLLTYIVAILRTVPLRGSSGQAEEMIAEFLGKDSARLFLHELASWLRSPFTKIDDWDRKVQYAFAEEEGAKEPEPELEGKARRLGPRERERERLVPYHYSAPDRYRPSPRSRNEGRGVRR